MKYKVVEDFLSNDESNYLYDYAIENCTDDPRPHYGFYPIGGSDLLNGDAHLDFDASKVLEAIEFGFKHFKENYEILGNFVLDRVHFNIMNQGAILHVHADDEIRYMQQENERQRRYVVSLFLNDDYAGGEFNFEDGKHLIIPPKGSLVLFPGWSLRHGVDEVLDGSRVNILIVYHDIF